MNSLTVVLIGMIVFALLNLTLFNKIVLKDNVQKIFDTIAGIGMAVTLLIILNKESNMYIKGSITVVCILYVIFSNLAFTRVNNVGYKKLRIIFGCLAVLGVMFVFGMKELYEAPPNTEYVPSSDNSSLPDVLTQEDLDRYLRN